MLAMEVLSEVHGEDTNEKGLPPGFRFHPTDEELISFYLVSKVFNGSFCGVEIAEVDLNRCEPWELPDVAKMGEGEWYFFSLRDRKYPTGLRTNRATDAGYWKATGKDREIYSAATGALLGMKKTLVFYRGRAPRGEKTKWVMHEYRLDGHFSYLHTCKEEWMICRIFHKTGVKKTPSLHPQCCLLEASSSPSTSLPQLFESTTTLIESQFSIKTLQNPYLIYQDSDLKNLINPVVSQPQQLAMSSFQASFSPSTSINTNNPSQSAILYNSLLSHQKHALNEPTVPKQCKTVPNFSPFQPPDARWENFQQNTRQNSLFEMGNGVWGLTAVADTVQEMSTSVVSDRAGFQMLQDPPIRGPGEYGA